jgi:hypothetical protein
VSLEQIINSWPDGTADTPRDAARMKQLCAYIRKLEKQITDADRVAWLTKRVTYIEHDDRDGIPAQKSERGGWWPQQPDDREHFPDYEGLTLVEYVDEQIKWERAK